MSRPTRTGMLAALAAAALAIAGCGDEESPSAAAAPEGDQASAERVVIEAADGAFDSQTIYETAGPGVVTVTSIFDASNSSPEVLGGRGGAAGQGSGFVISDDGEILTNAHVVTDASSTGEQSGPLNAADEVYVQFSDRNQVEAKVIGFDPFADVALLKIDPQGLDLNPLPLGSENDVEVGQGVAAIGSPFSQQQSLSVGIVSATDRSIPSLTDFNIEGGIQTDASINPGNSGGPLLDAAGEVVGINQQIRTSSGGSEGVGFAVPIDLAERSIEELREDGEVSYAYAGVSTQELYPQLADRLGLEVETGAIVAEVVDGSPADDAGLQAGEDTITFQGNPTTPNGGDVITAVDGEEITSGSDLPRIIALLDPGETVTLDVIRDGESEQVELTLGERSAEQLDAG